MLSNLEYVHEITVTEQHREYHCRGKRGWSALKYFFSKDKVKICINCYAHTPYITPFPFSHTQKREFCTSIQDRKKPSREEIIFCGTAIRQKVSKGGCRAKKQKQVKILQ